MVLGKRISISLEDLVSESNFVTVNHNDSLQSNFFEITNKCKGATAVVKKQKPVRDNTIRRGFKKNDKKCDITKIKAKDIMSSDPKL